MDNTEALILWQKRNFKIRVVLLVVLFILLGFVVYFKFGYQDPNLIGLNDAYGNKVISCKDALYYYAERELNYHPAGYNPMFTGFQINVTQK